MTGKPVEAVETAPRAQEISRGVLTFHRAVDTLKRQAPNYRDGGDPDRVSRNALAAWRRCTTDLTKSTVAAPSSRASTGHRVG